jgi:ankyrin repeat protein
VKAGADVNAKNKSGRTPLHVAVQKDARDSVASLLKAGSDPLATTGTDQSNMLHWAAQGNAGAPIFGALIKAGCDITSTDGRGRVPLHLAAADSAKALDVLLRLGADVKVKDNDGRTPLHPAAANGSVAAVRALLKAGAYAKARDNTGQTPGDLGKTPEAKALL